MLIGLDLVVGAVIGVLPALLLSRLGLWALRRWSTGPIPLMIAHAASWMLCSLAVAPFLPHSGEPYGLRAAVILLFPQLCLLLCDVVRRQGPKLPEGTRPDAPRRRTLIGRKVATR